MLSNVGCRQVRCPIKLLHDQITRCRFGVWNGLTNTLDIVRVMSHMLDFGNQATGNAPVPCSGGNYDGWTNTSRCLERIRISARKSPRENIAGVLMSLRHSERTRGPSPYELLLAALGACTSMTLRLYAQRKQWDLQRVTVRLQHFRIHAEDCMECETKEGFLDRIDREIELSGNLDDAQKRRLLEIAEHCPVHRTLTSEINIRTSLTS